MKTNGSYFLHSVLKTQTLSQLDDFDFKLTRED